MKKFLKALTLFTVLASVLLSTAGCYFLNNRDRLIWAASESENGDVTFTRTTSADIMITLTVSSAEEGYSVKDDPCASLYGKLCTALYTHDFRSLSEFFPDEAVKKEYTDYLEAENITLGDANANLDTTALELKPYSEMSFSYKLPKYKEYTPDSDEFKASFAEIKEDFNFEEYGMSESDVSAIRVYSISEYAFNFGGIFKTDHTKWGKFSDIVIMKYKDEWYLAPILELLRYMRIAAIRTDNHRFLIDDEKTGIIEDIKGDHISLSGHIYYYKEGIGSQFNIGDKVKIVYRAGYEINPVDENGENELYALRSIEKVE